MGVAERESNPLTSRVVLWRSAVSYSHMRKIIHRATSGS